MARSWALLGPRIAIVLLDLGQQNEQLVVVLSCDSHWPELVELDPAPIAMKAPR